ncbi:hypothetical protein BST81_21485 [Leptolyngbya sp. 'hensonii']|nr:hypothetical protein BST81_21485 [Leptolyngbya sp. 'hensonii']
MKRSQSTPSELNGTPETIIQLAPADPPDADPTEEGGEEAWSLVGIVGMVRRKVLIIGVMAVGVGCFMAYRSSKQIIEYQGSFQLLVEPVQEKQTLAQLTEAKGSSTGELDYSTQIEVMLSLKTLEPILKQVNQRTPGTDYGSVISKLSVIRLGETKIIQVSYHDTRADRVKAVLKGLSEGYLKYRTEDQKAQLRQGLDFVDKQLFNTQTRVNSLQQQIQRLRRQYNFTTPDTYGEQLASRLAIISQERQGVETELAVVEKQNTILKNPTNRDFSLSQSLAYQQLLQQYRALEQVVAFEATRFTPDSPNLQQLKEKQESLRSLLEAEAKRSLATQVTAIESQLQTLQIRQQALLETEKQVRQRLADLPAVSRQFTDLQREIGVATETLKRLLETQVRLQIQAAQNEVPWQLISPPGPPQRKPPNSLSKALITGGLGGAILGLVLAFLLEKLENTYYSLRELKKRVKLPLLGVIPLNPNLVPAVPKQRLINLPEQQPQIIRQVLAFWSAKPESHGFMEAFRSLYANLQRLETGGLRSIVISSALPREGRTTVAIHLAQAAAALGQKVLLVDTHLRPSGTQVHTLLGIPNKEGLSHLLAGEVSLEQVVQQIPWEKALYVITMGSTPSDPTRMLSSPSMPSLMAELHQTFDLVIYDMPPLMGLADVNLIASATDGVLLVTALGRRGSAEALNQTLERIKIAHLSVLGIAANKVRDYTVDLYQ